MTERKIITRKIAIIEPFNNEKRACFKRYLLVDLQRPMKFYSLSEQIEQNTINGLKRRMATAPYIEQIDDKVQTINHVTKQGTITYKRQCSTRFLDIAASIFIPESELLLIVDSADSLKNIGFTDEAIARTEGYLVNDEMIKSIIGDREYHFVDRNIRLDKIVYVDEASLQEDKKEIKRLQDLLKEAENKIALLAIDSAKIDKLHSLIKDIDQY